MKIVILICLMLIILLIIYQNIKTRKKIFNISQKENANINKHMYSNSEYFHYSKIQTEDTIIHPTLQNCTKYEILLKANDMLYIPKKWWRWIETFGRTLIINFSWKDGNIYLQNNKLESIEAKHKGKNLEKINMFQINDDNDNNDEKCSYVLEYPVMLRNHILNTKNKFTDDYLLEKIKEVDVSNNYDTHLSKISLNDFINSNRENEYVTSFNKNNDIKHMLMENIIIPIEISTTNPIFNLYLSYNYIDNGLYYDDVDELICVIDGTIKIRMYSPLDTIYLEPYPEIPENITIIPKNNISYNLYKFIPWIIQPNKNSYPSSFLLYKFIKDKHLMTIVETLYKLYDVGNIVYEICKYDDLAPKQGSGAISQHIADDIIKFKFYFNNINKIPGNITIENRYDPIKWITNLHHLLNITIDNFDKTNLIKSSFSYEVDTQNIDIELYYYIPISHNYFPIYLVKINENKENKEIIITDFKTSLISNLNIYLSIFGKTECYDWIVKELNKLNLAYDFVASININDTSIELYWLGLPIIKFIEFLKEYKWNPDFILWIENNIDKLNHLSHEIHVTYNFNGTSINSSFYGII